ncbi:MAG: multidrug transporter, partial [Sphingomonas sp.]
MPAWEVLNREQHADLRASRRIDGARHFAQIVADEFPLAAPHYPILFTKNAETGAFYAGVVMGVEPGRNLLSVDGALPDYRPADLERQGFFVAEGQVVIDPDHVAFADPAGQPHVLPIVRMQRHVDRLQQPVRQPPPDDRVGCRDALLQRPQRLLHPLQRRLRFTVGSEQRLARRIGE